MSYSSYTFPRRMKFKKDDIIKHKVDSEQGHLVVLIAEGGKYTLRTKDSVPNDVTPNENSSQLTPIHGHLYIVGEYNADTIDNVFELERKIRAGGKRKTRQRRKRIRKSKKSRKSRK